MQTDPQPKFSRLRFEFVSSVSEIVFEKQMTDTTICNFLFFYLIIENPSYVCVCQTVKFVCLRKCRL